MYFTVGIHVNFYNRVTTILSGIKRLEVTLAILYTDLKHCNNSLQNFSVNIFLKKLKQEVSQE